MSTRANIYLSVFNIGSFCIYWTTVSKFQLNVDHTAMYDIALLVGSSIGLKWFLTFLFFS